MIRTIFHSFYTNSRVRDTYIQFNTDIHCVTWRQQVHQVHLNKCNQKVVEHSSDCDVMLSLLKVTSSLSELILPQLFTQSCWTVHAPQPKGERTTCQCIHCQHPVAALSGRHLAELWRWAEPCDERLDEDVSRQEFKATKPQHEEESAPSPPRPLFLLFCDHFHLILNPSGSYTQLLLTSENCHSGKSDSWYWQTVFFSFFLRRKKKGKVRSCIRYLSTMKMRELKLLLKVMIYLKFRLESLDNHWIKLCVWYFFFSWVFFCRPSPVLQ